MRTAMTMGGIGLVAVATAATFTGGCASCQLSQWMAYGEIPDLDMAVGDTVEIEVWRHFLPEECQEDPFSEGFVVKSSDSAAVAVETDGYFLTIVALDVADSVSVVVWSPMDGHDGPSWGSGEGKWATRGNAHEFRVRVRPRGGG